MGRTVWLESICVEYGLRAGEAWTAGDEGRLLEALEGRPLSLLFEDPLEESEKETLWPGESMLPSRPLPSEVLGRCHIVWEDIAKNVLWWGSYDAGGGMKSYSLLKVRAVADTNGENRKNTAGWKHTVNEAREKQVQVMAGHGRSWHTALLASRE